MKKIKGQATLCKGHDTWYKKDIEGYEFFWNDISLIVHRARQIRDYDKDWMVTEPRTGLDVGHRCYGKTKQESIDSTIHWLDSLGLDRVKETIELEISKNREIILND